MIIAHMKHLLFFFLFTFLVSILQPMDFAHAQGRPEKKKAKASIIQEIDPLDFKLTLPKEEFLKNTVLRKGTPYNDEKLAYTVYLPKDWVQIKENELNKDNDDLELNNRLLGEVAKYVSPPIGDDHEIFRINALRMDVLMNIEYWFRDFMSVKGLYIDGMKVFSADLLHAEYNIFDEQGRSYLVRAVIQRNGARVIVSEYLLPIKMKNDRNYQRWTMTLFRLSNLVENLSDLTENYEYLNIARHLYPKNWGVIPGDYDSVHEIFGTIGRVKIKDEGKPYEKKYIDKEKGFVDILLVSKSVFEDVNLLIKNILAQHENRGLDMDNEGVIERGKGKKERGVIFTPTKVYRSPTETGYELWISYNETAQSYFIALMLIPDRRFNYMLWAENVEGFNVILNSFSPILLSGQEE